MKTKASTRTVLILAVLLLGTNWRAHADARGGGREEGEFRILIGGKEIGSERFLITTGPESISSTSTVEFRNPGEMHQKVQLTTRLEMDSHYVPRDYELKRDVDGKTGMIRGSFSPHEAMFEYVAGETPIKRGVLVGTQYSLLDTNVFHHFIFLTRLFASGVQDKSRSFDVVIPQESDTGTLKITEVDRETIGVRGKKTEARRLQVDSGSVLIQLWVNNQNVLDKIALPGKGIEVIRVK